MRASSATRCTANVEMCVRFDSSRHTVSIQYNNNNGYTALTSLAFARPNDFDSTDDRVCLNEMNDTLSQSKQLMGFSLGGGAF